MQPDIDELRHIRDSYYRNNTYERNRRYNSDRIRNNRRNYGYDYRPGYESSSSNSDNGYRNYENVHSYYYRNYNRHVRRRGLFEKIKILIKAVFNRDENVIYAIIIINIIVFIAWEYAIYNKEVYYDTKLLDFMNDNFTISWYNFVNRKRYWTLLTSMFSHKDIIHLSNNMLSFYSFSIPVIRCIKKKKFITSYLFSGLCSSIAHIIFYHSFVPRLNKNVNRSIIYDLLFSRNIRNTYDSVTGLGASGAIVGINTIFACLYPSSLITYNNYLRLPAWLTMSLFILGDFYRSITLTNGQVGTICHVGGGIAGYIYYLYNLKPFIYR